MNKIKRKKTVTIKDIADRLNISQNAVSLALNNKPGVSDTLQEAIKQCEQGLKEDPLSFTARVHLLFCFLL